MDKRKFAVLSYLLCFIGFCYQLNDILSVYFNYQTVNSVNINIRTELIVPDVSFCVRHIDIFDYERYEKDFNHTFSFKENDQNDTLTTSEKVFETADHTTIKQFFNYTPKTNDLFESCFVRRPGSYFFDIYKGADCYDLFSISRFFIQEFICYRFHIHKYVNDTFRYANIGYSQTYTGVFYYVTLSEKAFKKANLIKFTVNSNDPSNYPDTSIAYSSVVIRYYNESTEKADFNHFNVNYYQIETYRLPDPYPTQCIDYDEVGFTSQRDCFTKCFTNYTLKYYNKVPFSVIIHEKMDFKHLGFDDVANETSSKFLEELEDDCELTCKWKDCHFAKTITSVELDPFPSIRFQLKIPREPTFVVTYIPKIHLSEIIIYILSLLGTWFGFSVLSYFRMIQSWTRKLINRDSPLITAKSGSRWIKQTDMPTRRRRKSQFPMMVDERKRDLINMGLKHKNDIHSIWSEIKAIADNLEDLSKKVSFSD